MQGGVTVHVLAEKIAEAEPAASVAGLRAEGSQPHEVAGLYLGPIASR